MAVAAQRLGGAQHDGRDKQVSDHFIGPLYRRTKDITVGDGNADKPEDGQDHQRRQHTAESDKRFHHP